MLTVAEAASRPWINPETVLVRLGVGKLQGRMPGGDKMGYRIPQSEICRVLFGEPGKAAA